MEGPDDFKQNGTESSKSRKAVKKAGLKDLGYHPLEEIPSKNDRKVLASEIQLSSAAFARTIAEVYGVSLGMLLREDIFEPFICSSADQ